MIEEHEIIFFDEKFIKPPKRGKTYSNSEFESYLGMIGAVRDIDSNNYRALKKIANEVDEKVNEKLKDYQLKSMVYELFFSFRGQVYRYASANSRSLSKKESWTYENLIKVYRKTVQDLTNELNAHVRIVNDKEVFSTKSIERFVELFHSYGMEYRFLLNNEKWYYYFEDRFFKSDLLVQYMVLDNYGIDFRFKKGDSISTKELVQALLRKKITYSQFKDIQEKTLQYNIERELERFRGDRKALKNYVAQLYEKFVEKNWKMTLPNIGKALETKIEYGKLQMIFLKGVSGGISLEGGTIDPILKKYRLNLSLSETQIRENIIRKKSSSTNYEFMKPENLIPEKTLSELHLINERRDSNTSTAQAQRIRILKLKYTYNK